MKEFSIEVELIDPDYGTLDIFLNKNNKVWSTFELSINENGQVTNLSNDDVYESLDDLLKHDPEYGEVVTLGLAQTFKDQVKNSLKS